MTDIIKCTTLRFLVVDDEAHRGRQIAALLDQQGPVMAQMSRELATYRDHYRQYCEAIEDRNRELSELEGTIGALKERCRKEARYKCWWMAAFCFTVLGWLIYGH